MENSTLATTDQLTDVVTNGAQILQKNELRVQKALSVGNTILELIASTGMSHELDERANNFLVNCRNAKNEMEVSRKPITQFFDSIKKKFTESENALDIAKAESVPAKLQSHRNAYVQKIKLEEEKKRAAAQEKLDKENEIISIKTSLEGLLSTYVQNHILSRKQNLQTGFNAITLANYTEKAANLKALIPKHNLDFHAFAPILSGKYCTDEELQNICIAFMQEKDFTLIAGVIEGELMKFKNELVEKLPSLKTQLEELEKAGEEEKKRLAEQKADREKKEQEALEAKTAADKKAREDELELQKTSQQTEAMMDNLAVIDEVAPESRSGFNLAILSPAGIVEVFNFWFQKEGVTMSVADLEKKTIAQMKTFCQNYAHKHGEKIVSKNVNYEPVFKAVNRK